MSRICGLQDLGLQIHFQLQKEIEAELSNAEITIPDLSEKMGMSEIQMYRKLKALIGQPPSQFVKSIRLEKNCKQ